MAVMSNFALLSCVVFFALTFQLEVTAKTIGAKTSASNSKSEDSPLVQLMPAILQNIKANSVPSVPSLSKFVEVVRNASKEAAKSKTGELTSKKLTAYKKKLLDSLSEATDTPAETLKKIKKTVDKLLKNMTHDVDHLLLAVAEGGELLGNGTKEGREGVAKLLGALATDQGDKGLAGSDQGTAGKNPSKFTDDFGQEGSAMDGVFDDLKAGAGGGSKGPGVVSLPGVGGKQTGVSVPGKQDTKGLYAPAAFLTQGSQGMYNSGQGAGSSPSSPAQSGPGAGRGGGFNIGALAGSFGGLLGSMAQRKGNGRSSKGGNDLGSLISGLDSSYAPAGSPPIGGKGAGDKESMDVLVNGVGALFTPQLDNLKGGPPKGGVEVTQLVNSLGGFLNGGGGGGGGQGGGWNLGALLGGGGGQGGGGGGINIGSVIGGIFG